MMNCPVSEYFNCHKHFHKVVTIGLGTRPNLKKNMEKKKKSLQKIQYEFGTKELKGIVCK